jgi:SulP family sulfate permease
LLAAVLSLDIAQIRAVPTGVPQFAIPHFSVDELPYVIRFALVLAFLGSIDSLLTPIVADSLTRSTHDSNRELIGQGIGNIVSGLFSGLPGAGATMRTLINVRAGVAIMMSTLLLTVLVDLITAFAVGFIMASVSFVARMADAQINNARLAFGADQVENLTPKEAEILEHGAGRIVLFHVEGPLSFGSAREVARLLQSTIEKDVLAIDLRDVPFIDRSACTALHEVIQRFDDDGDRVLLFGARQRVKNSLQQTGVLERRIDALHLARAIIEQNLAVRG